MGQFRFLGRDRKPMINLSMDFARFAEPPIPADLILHVNGTPDVEHFLRGGMEVATMLQLAAKQFGGKLIEQSGRVLDFGCGCGRILRFLDREQAETSGTRIHGCDTDSRVIAYAKKAHPWVDLDVTPTMPPLPYAANFFDLIYAFSVFSHLREDVEALWLAELARIGRSGCLYLLTVHGDWFIESTMPERRQEMEDAGGFYLAETGELYSSFPDYYHQSYHTSDYLRREWSAHFEILDIIRGDDAARYAFGGAQPATELPMRPMGQDLVVARKRVIQAARCCFRLSISSCRSMM